MNPKQFLEERMIDRFTDEIADWEDRCAEEFAQWLDMLDQQNNEK